MKTFVCGHRNPDVDSVMSAYALADLRRRTGTPDVEAVCASISGVLGLDIIDLIHNVAPVIDECARRQWQALNKGA